MSSRRRGDTSTATSEKPGVSSGKKDPVDDKDEHKDETPRVLREREIINLFMACGIFDHIAKDIYKSCPELATITEKHVEDFKQVLRESLAILDKEGVPDITIGDTHEENSTPRVKSVLCRICSDSAAIKATYPDKMGKWFRINQGFKGRLRKDEWLCKGCYGEWYRANREWLMDKQSGKAEESSEEQVDESEESGKEETDKKQPRKEYYIKNIVLLLFLVVKNMAPQAVHHRKMLVRYVTLHQLTLNQLPTALYCLRKIGNGIIDQEDFETNCGIGQFADLFGYGTWDTTHTQTEILHINEVERMRKKELKRQQKEKEELEKKQQAEDEKKEKDRQKQLEKQLQQAENDAIEAAKVDKLKKLQESRKKEDDELIEQRKKQEQLKLKQKEKKETDKKNRQKQREQELRDIDASFKAKEEELKHKREERYRKQRAEIQQRAADRRNQIKELELAVPGTKKN